MMWGRGVGVVLFAVISLTGSCQIVSAHRDRHRERRDWSPRGAMRYPMVWVVPDSTDYGRVRTHLRRYRRYSDFPFYGFTIDSPAGSYPVYRYYRDYVPYESWYPPTEFWVGPQPHPDLLNREIQQNWRLEDRGIRILNRLDERRGRFLEGTER